MCERQILQIEGLRILGTELTNVKFINSGIISQTFFPAPWIINMEFINRIISQRVINSVLYMYTPPGMINRIFVNRYISQKYLLYFEELYKSKRFSEGDKSRIFATSSDDLTI